MRWLLDLFRPSVRGHICPAQARKRVLQAIAAHCGREIPITAPDCEFQVAVIEAVDALVVRAENAERVLRVMLEAYLGTALPVEAEIDPEVVLRVVLSWRRSNEAAQG